MTALVLSAGGMFGAWQVGAWRALQDRLRPDIVIGTSAGAMNGWAVAGGASARDLAAEWLDPRMADLMRLRSPFLRWRGLFEPDAIREKAREMFARYRPRVPFALTMVEVPRLRLCMVCGDEIRWEHLAASCAVPFGYPSVRIDGKRYVDGGLLGALPLWAAAEMGATRAWALNALPLMPSRTLRAGVSLLQRMKRARAAPPSLEVIPILPREPLGSLRDALVWDAARIQRWIEQGERDARISFTI